MITYTYTEHQLTRLQRELDAYMAKWKAEGKPSLPYTTPCCASAQETTAPSNTSEQWDSMCLCPKCGAMYWKNVTHDAVVVQLPPKE
jgi:hypothetical protein